jgi:3-hydroxybutyryl-CoA dehydratase
MVFHGKWYGEVKVGDSFGSSLTVTETHLVLAAGMFGDFNPLHVDEEFSKKSLFGGRILHGPFTSALVSAPVGNFFAGTAIAYLEHSCRFKAPVRAGDTLATKWTVTEKIDKPKHKGGIFVLTGQATNQRHELAVECEGKILVASKT